MTTSAYRRTAALTAYARVHTPEEAASLVSGGGDAACSCDSPALAAVPDTYDVESGGAGAVTWSGVLGMEGVLTGDGRYIEPGALQWEDLPIPLRYVSEDSGMHDGAQVVGRILSIERHGKEIRGTGDFDANSDIGREAVRQVQENLTPGVSMDLDRVSFEVRVAGDLFDEVMGPEEAEPEEPERDSEGRVKVAEIKADDEVMATTDARVRAATMVAIPAFSEAKITLDNPAPIEDEEDGEPLAASLAAAEEAEAAEDRQVARIVAGGFPVAPPTEWFHNPNLSEPTPLTVESSGRVYGHLAVWGTCHTAYSGQCVEPPKSGSGYSYFRTGSVVTEDGTEVSVGAITLDTLHASDKASAADTLAHYEHTGRGVCDVAAGEDAYGIWIAGALRPGVTEQQVRTLRASPLSGDWRRIGGGLELVAALAVNVPGFPVPRPKGLVASGSMTSLVAAGMLAPRKVKAPGSPGSLTADDLRYLKRLAARERREDAQRREGTRTQADEMAARLRGTRAAVLARRAGLTRGEEGGQ